MKSTGATYLVVVAVAFVVVFGALAVLATLSTSSSPATPKYPVKFYEVGLPVGSDFSVVLSGVENTTLVESGEPSVYVGFSVSAGLYAWYTIPVNHYQALPASGHIQVSGGTNDTIDWSATSTPIGSAFAAGNPVSWECPTGDTYAVNGCTGGDWTYRLVIESSAIEFEDVAFEVTTPTGAVYVLPAGSGGFSLLNISGSIAAQFTATSFGSPDVMTGPWTTYGGTLNGTSPLTPLYTIVLDMGTSNPAGMGLAFVALGLTPYSGTTAPLSLP